MLDLNHIPIRRIPITGYYSKLPKSDDQWIQRQHKSYHANSVASCDQRSNAKYENENANVKNILMSVSLYVRLSIKNIHDNTIQFVAILFLSLLERQTFISYIILHFNLLQISGSLDSAASALRIKSGKSEENSLSCIFAFLIAPCTLPSSRPAGIYIFYNLNQ